MLFEYSDSMYKSCYTQLFHVLRKDHTGQADIIIFFQFILFWILLSSTPVPRQTIKSSRGRRLLQTPKSTETPIFVHWNHAGEVYFRKHKIEIDSLNPFISFFRVLAYIALAA
jgi:hypothetical protein